MCMDLIQTSQELFFSHLPYTYIFPNIYMYSGNMNPKIKRSYMQNRMLLTLFNNRCTLIRKRQFFSCITKTGEPCSCRGNISE